MDTTLMTSAVTILSVWGIAVLLPGPNFFATAHTAAARSRGLGMATAAGVAAGTALWAAGSLLGLGLLFQAASWLYQVVKWCGAAYLVWMGVKTVWGAGKARAAHGATVRPLTLWAAFRHGLVVDLGNPKAAAFFTSLFTVSVPPLAPLWFKAGLVGLVVGVSLAWYGTVACLVTVPGVSRALERSSAWVARVTGAIFVGLGIQLAVDR
ncbi:MAG: LysE family transporter [Desulfovibrionaceae bacterium]